MSDANIERIHDYIDNTSRMISQKSDLIKNLQNKKSFMINSIENTLNRCRNAERTLYNEAGYSLSGRATAKLNEYNTFLSEQHDKGSTLIGNINATKNFQQLDRVESTMVNPFLTNLKNKCSFYARDIPRFSSVSSVSAIRHNPPPSPTHIKTTGLGRTKVDFRHENGVSVNIAKESVPGSPGHNISVSSKGPVSLTHEPSIQPDHLSSPGPIYVTQPVSVQTVPVQTVQTVPVQTIRTVPVQTIRTVPVQTIRTVPVQPVQTIRTVPVQTVKVIQPVQTVRTVPVQTVKVIQPVRTVPIQTVRTVPVQTVKVIQPIRTIRTVHTTPVHVISANRAVLTHDYVPRIPNGKLSLRKGTVVNIAGYSGDWALVDTATGRRGYVSRHYLRQI